MMVRLFHWNELDVYRFYNRWHPGYPHDLPPPPNPEGLACFMLACLDVTIQQMNAEADPKEAEKQQLERDRAAQAKWEENRAQYRR